MLGPRVQLVFQPFRFGNRARAGTRQPNGRAQGAKPVAGPRKPRRAGEKRTLGETRRGGGVQCPRTGGGDQARTVGRARPPGRRLSLSLSGIAAFLVYFTPEIPQIPNPRFSFCRDSHPRLVSGWQKLISPKLLEKKIEALKPRRLGGETLFFSKQGFIPVS